MILKSKFSLTAAVLAFLCFVSCSDKRNEIVIEGIYSGKNLFIMNQFSGEDEDNPFCIKKIVVNNVVVEEIKSTAIEVNFKQMKIEEGDEVKVVIETSEPCKAKVLNPEVL